MPIATVNGVQIAYRDAGQGAPLLLIHAFPLNGQMWEEQITTLSQNYRVIVPDLRGFGSSQLVPGPTTLDQYATDLAGLLDQLGLNPQRVTIAGLSMGGYIAFAFWRLFRERVHSLMLVSTKATADSEEAKQKRAKDAELVETEGPSALADAVLPGLLSEDASSALQRRARQIIMQNDASGISAALHAMAARPDSTDTMRSIDVPTVIMVGTADKVTPVSDAENMYQQIANSRLIKVEGAGHLLNLENPSAFQAGVDSLLRTV